MGFLMRRVNLLSQHFGFAKLCSHMYVVIFNLPNGLVSFRQHASQFENLMPKVGGRHVRQFL